LNDGEAILEAIKADPAEDLHRLIYADWLEENDHPERASFIRHQIAAARTGQVDCQEKRWFSGSTPPGYLVRCGECAFCRPMIAAQTIHKTRGLELIGDLPFSCAHVAKHPSLEKEEAPNWFVLYLWRGFVTHVTCPMHHWLDHGARLCELHPVEKVVPCDRFPREDSRDLFGWWNESISQHDDEYDEIPEEVWRLLDGDKEFHKGWVFFDSRQKAIDALSAALIEYARRPQEATP
jgi:uncharacterized protein (TIGR02996 family)